MHRKSAWAFFAVAELAHALHSPSFVLVSSKSRSMFQRAR